MTKRTRLEERNEEVNKYYKIKQSSDEIVSQELQNLRENAQILFSYAKSFSHVGNESVAEDLRLIGRDLINSADHIQKAQAAESTAALAEGQSNMGFMLGTILDANTLKDK